MPDDDMRELRWTWCMLNCRRGYGGGEKIVSPMAVAAKASAGRR